MWLKLAHAIGRWFPNTPANLQQHQKGKGAIVWTPHTVMHSCIIHCLDFCTHRNSTVQAKRGCTNYTTFLHLTAFINSHLQQFPSRNFSQPQKRTIKIKMLHKLVAAPSTFLQHVSPYIFSTSAYFSFMVMLFCDSVIASDQLLIFVHWV